MVNEEELRCFRCGNINSIDEPKCESCGEDGMVTFEGALDIVNDMYHKGYYKPEVDEYRELDFDHT